jgi:hypothetical protein
MGRSYRHRLASSLAYREARQFGQLKDEMMLKPILLGSALLLSIPALAQTTGSTGNTGQNSGTPTTTNDHDPTMEDDAEGTTNATVGTQVNGGVTSSSTGAQGTTGSTGNHSGMNHGTTGQGTTGSTGNHSGMNHGTTGQGSTTGATRSGTATGITRSGSTTGGTMSGGMSSGGGMSGGQGMSGSSAMAGGGMQAGNYPPCSRTVTDQCIQTNERGRRRR